MYDLVYLKGVFQGFRIAHDYTLGYLYIPSLFIIAPIFFWFFLNKKARKRNGFLKCLLTCIIWIVATFYITWGFNYAQPNMFTRLNLEEPVLDSTYITNTFHKQTKVLVDLKDSLTGKTYEWNKENDIRLVQEEILEELGYPVGGRVRVRRLLPGFLLHFRTSGIYIPHSFEGHIDFGLYRKQHPFTTAHEMSHGYGVTDESDANFIAYLTCKNSSDLETRYSGELAYWRYLAGYYKEFHTDTWEKEYNELDIRIIQDLTLISNHIDKYKEWMPQYRDKIYDSYLKSHGVKAGIRSYDRMILLIAAYNSK